MSADEAAHGGKTIRTFVSYVRENTATVDRLATALESAGVEVWIDKARLLPGMRWADEIRRGIATGDSFVACFSREYAAKSRTYMNEELTLAIDELRHRPTDTAWFIPVKLNECEIPDRSIGGGETLRSLQFVELYRDWSDGVSQILSVVAPPRPPSARTGAAAYGDSLNDPPLFLVKEIPRAEIRKLIKRQFGADTQVDWKTHQIRYRAKPGHNFSQDLFLGEWLDAHLKPELSDAYGPGDIDYFETQDKGVVRVFWGSGGEHRILRFTQERVFRELYEFRNYISTWGLAFCGCSAILLLLFRALQLKAFDRLHNWNWGSVHHGIYLEGSEASTLWALLSWLIWSWEQHTGRSAVIERCVGVVDLTRCPLQCLANIDGTENQTLQRVIKEERLSPPVSLAELWQLLHYLEKDSVIAPAIVELRAKLS